jgi:membrane protein implicated in regulation of membrane protease activity
MASGGFFAIGAAVVVVVLVRVRNAVRVAYRCVGWLVMASASLAVSTRGVRKKKKKKKKKNHQHKLFCFLRSP